LVLASPTWALPEALWSHLPAGAQVSWRVVTLDAQGGQLAVSGVGTFVAGAAPDVTAQQTVSLPDFSGAAALDALGATDTVVSGEFLVSVPQGQLAETVASLSPGAFPVETVTMANGGSIVRFKTGLGADTLTAVQNAQGALAASVVGAQSAGSTPRSVPVAQANFVYKTQLTPTDPFYASTPRYQYAPQAVNAEEAWTAGITGAGILVAVIDTGLNSGVNLHQEFNGVGKVVLGPDYVNNDNDPTDDNNHGTNVAGIALAEADGIGTVGIAPEASLMPIKALNAAGSGSTLSIVRGIEHAVANGARVINMSLGSNVFGELPSAIGYDLFYDTAIRDAEDRGVVVVAAAGNDRSSLPARPAAFNDTIYVGAINNQDELTEFSNYGPWLTVVAPGKSMYSPRNTGTTAYSYQSGTSQATPVVAGAVALILSAHPALTPRQVKELIQQSAADLGATGRDDFFGHGRLDVAAALGLAAGPDTTLPALVRIEMNTTTFVATFSQNMLSGGGANAVDNPSNWLASAPLSTFLFTPVGRTISYNAGTRQLTVTHSSVTLSGANLFVIADTVTNTSGRPIFSNRDTAGQEGAQRQNDTGQSDVDTSVAQSYAAAVATDDGVVKLRFRYPMDEASVENSANYSITSSPTNTGGTTPPGGSSVSLVGTTLVYDSASNTVTISNLPSPLTTTGTTFAVEMTSGMLQDDLDNPIDAAAHRPIFGQVVQASATASSLTGVSTIVNGNPFAETVRLTFSKPLQTDSALFTPSNYAVTVNSLPVANPSDLEIIYYGASREVILAGYNLLSNNGQSISVTVSNLRDVNGNLISGVSATVAGTVSSGNFVPEYRSLAATTNEVQVRFSFWTKMNATNVVNPANWTLLSDPASLPTTSIPLGSATFTYDGEHNVLRIGNLSLTAGHRVNIVAGAGVTKRFTGNTFSSPDYAAYLGSASLVGGNGEFSPVTPTSLKVVKSGTLSLDNVINQANQANLSVEVNLPAGTAAGNEVTVSLIDSSTPPKVVTATGVAAGGAQTLTVSGLNATSLALGTVFAQAVTTTGTSNFGNSDITAQLATKTADLPVEMTAFSLE